MDNVALGDARALTGGCLFAPAGVHAGAVERSAAAALLRQSFAHPAGCGLTRPARAEGSSRRRAAAGAPPAAGTSRLPQDGTRTSKHHLAAPFAATACNDLPMRFLPLTTEKNGAR